MAVNIIWSLTNGGAAISDPLDHGTGGTGDVLTAQTIYIEHDGANQIIDCGFYIGEKSGTYAGDFSAPADLVEVLGWGDGGDADSFGGFQINMDKVGGYSAGAWPVWNGKQPTNGTAFFTGVGDSIANKIPLPIAMGLGSIGVIPSGSSPDIAFQARFELPANETQVGIREIDQKLRFTFTS